MFRSPRRVAPKSEEPFGYFKEIDRFFTNVVRLTSR